MSIRHRPSRIGALPSMQRRLVGAMSLALLLGAGLAPQAARAQTYPAKPIRLIIPFAAGGSTDVAARMVAEEMSKALGQTIVAENRPGNGGGIGIDAVSKSAPDGYTIGLSGSGPTLLLNLIGQHTGYTTKDLTMIGFVNTVEMIMIARPDLPANTAAELIAYMKANPGKLTQGNSGSGGVAHLASEYFDAMAGVTGNHVPYKGDAPIMNDLMGGVLDTGMVGVASSAAMIKSGKVKAIGLAGGSKLTSVPTVPLINATGLPGYEAYTWNVLVGPAGLPGAVVDRLNSALNTAVKSPALREKFENLGLILGKGGTPKDANDFVAAEQVKWEKVVKLPGIKLKD